MQAKIKRRRLRSILLSLVMAAGLLPAAALAAAPAVAPAAFEADPDMALSLLNAAKTGAADSTWDGSTNTLTLNGVNFTTTAATAVILPEGATIVLNGDNTITGGDASMDNCYGIYAWGDLTIQGSGTLTVTTGNSTEVTCCGIYANNNLVISGTVTATGGSAGYYSYGVFAQDSVGVTGTLTAAGGTARDCSFGIDGANYVSISGAVTATGGRADHESNGIHAGRDVFISGTAQVTAAGGTSTAAGDAQYYGSYGIAAGNDVTVSGTARLTAIGGSATGGSAEGGRVYDGSYGIVAGNQLILSDTAQATAAGGDESVFCIMGSVSTGGHTITFGANGGAGYLKAVTGGATAYTLPANGFAAPEGKQFRCWRVDGVERAAGETIQVTAGTTVTAVWGYTVSFAANGGTGTMPDASGISGDYTLPENGFAAPEGKRFRGWAIRADGAVIPGASITVSGDTTLYAIWAELSEAPAEHDSSGGAGRDLTQHTNESLPKFSGPAQEEAKPETPSAQTDDNRKLSDGIRELLGGKRTLLIVVLVTLIVVISIGLLGMVIADKKKKNRRNDRTGRR